MTEGQAGQAGDVKMSCGARVKVKGDEIVDLFRFSDFLRCTMVNHYKQIKQMWKLCLERFPKHRRNKIQEMVSKISRFKDFDANMLWWSWVIGPKHHALFGVGNNHNPCRISFHIPQTLKVWLICLFDYHKTFDPNVGEYTIHWVFGVLFQATPFQTKHTGCQGVVFW